MIRRNSLDIAFPRYTGRDTAPVLACLVLDARNWEVDRAIPRENNPTMLATLAGWLAGPGRGGQR